MTAARHGDRAETQDGGRTRAIGGPARKDLTPWAESAAFTGDVVLLATDQDRARTSMRTLLQLSSRHVPLRSPVWARLHVRT